MCVNYLGVGAGGPVRGACGENYERLAAVKSQYHPTSFFRSNQNIAATKRRKPGTGWANATASQLVGEYTGAQGSEGYFGAGL